MEKEDGTINACPECGHYRSKNKMMITTSSGSVDYDLLFLYLSKRKKSFLQLQLHSTFFSSSLSSLFCLKFFFFIVTSNLLPAFFNDRLTKCQSEGKSSLQNTDVRALKNLVFF